MSDKSNIYGYVPPTVPTQEQGSNTGVFSTDEVYALKQAGKWSEIDALELIQKTTMTGSTHEVQFTDLRLTEFNNYMLFVIGAYQNTTANQMILRFSTDGGTTYISTGYHFARYFMRTDGTSVDTSRATNGGSILIGRSGSNSITYTQNSLIYLNNLAGTDRYPFTAHHEICGDQSGGYFDSIYTGGLYPNAVEVNALRIACSNGTSDIYGTFMLFGIKDYK